MGIMDVILFKIALYRLLLLLLLLEKTIFSEILVFKTTAFQFTLDYVPIKDKTYMKLHFWVFMILENSSEEGYIGFKMN